MLFRHVVCDDILIYIYIYIIDMCDAEEKAKTENPSKDVCFVSVESV